MEEDTAEVAVEDMIMVAGMVVVAAAEDMIMAVDMEVAEVRRLATHAPIRLCLVSSVVDSDAFAGHSWVHEWFIECLSVSYGVHEIV